MTHPASHDRQHRACAGWFNKQTPQIPNLPPPYLPSFLPCSLPYVRWSLTKQTPQAGPPHPKSHPHSSSTSLTTSSSTPPDDGTGGSGSPRTRSSSSSTCTICAKHSTARASNSLTHAPITRPHQHHHRVTTATAIEFHPTPPPQQRASTSSTHAFRQQQRSTAQSPPAPPVKAPCASNTFSSTYHQGVRDAQVEEQQHGPRPLGRRRWCVHAVDGAPAHLWKKRVDEHEAVERRGGR